MEIRKIQRSGNSSYIISLPVEWVRAHDIKKNDPVEMTTHPDGSISIQPSGKTRHKAEVKTFNLGKKINHDYLFRKMIGCYVNGSTTIELRTSTEFPFAVRNIVSRFIEVAVGQEVVEEDNNRIVVADILNQSEMPMEKTIKRMYVISRKMLSDSIQAIDESNTGLSASVKDIDYEVDRLYWLISRKHNSFLKYPNLATKEGLTLNDSNVYFISGKMIERISDHAVRISKYSPRLINDRKSKKARRMIAALGYRCMDIYADTMKSLYKRDPRSANDVIELVSGMQKDFDSVLKEAFKTRGPVSIPVAYITEGLQRICNYNKGICETVIDYLEGEESAEI